MKSPDLRYIVVKNEEGIIRGFTSLMPTYEEGEPVVYCYEIHLTTELQRYVHRNIFTLLTELYSFVFLFQPLRRFNLTTLAKPVNSFPRTGLGRLLMSFLESVASHTPPIKKIMLTCFLSNQRALAFYKSAGFTKDPISPVPKKLRYGREFIPDYVIMSKNVKSKAVLDTAPL